MTAAPALTVLALLLCAAAQAQAPAYTLHGQWRQGELLIGKTAPGSRVVFDGRALSLTPDGLFVFGLDRDEKPEATLEVQRPGQPARIDHFIVKRYNWQTQRVDGLAPDKVNPPPEAEARIEKEGAEIKAARAMDTPLPGFAQHWQWPVHGEISGLFGRQRILNGTPKQPHYGLDIAAPTGTRVLSPADGIVRLAEPDLYFTGGTLIVDHGHGVFSIFAHLSALRAAPGQKVARGELLALSGATGRATGPHLHWGVYWFDAHCDPQRLVQAAK